jgi:hypothetical protein
MRTTSRGLVVLVLAAIGAAGSGVYWWLSARPLQDRAIAVLETQPNRAISNPTRTPPGQVVSPPPTKSLLQLHAEFRESQRCMDERFIVRGNVSYHLSMALPPHISGCDDLKGAFRKVYEATTAAAKSGDVDAQMCYLMQGAGDRETGFRLSEAEIAEYQSLAPAYVNAAFKRGDWRVVELLGFHVIDWAGMFINLEQWLDPLREYKADQLLRLGAGEVDPEDPDPWLYVLRMPESKENWKLSAQEMLDGDAWAQETYDKYFVSQPRLTKKPKVCTSEDEAR